MNADTNRPKMSAPTPETDNLARGNHVVPTEWAEQLERERDEALEKYTALATENMLAVNRLAEERDEARAVAYDLAVIASHCLGWHDHESSEAAIRIAAALKRWKKSK